jgi:DNA-binding transcriptional LysR family regulator
MRTAFEGQRARSQRLSAMDLNLLVAFEALYLERSVTKAGRRLGLSQPATSAALSKLRAVLDDQLFVKTPRGLEPTERCEALARPVAQALADLRDALGDEAFDLRTTDRVFRIGAVDAVIAVVLPQVAARLMTSAPNAQLSLRSIDPGSAIALLDSRDIDLAVAPVADVPAHFGARELFPVPLVLAMRPDHPLGDAPTLEDVVRYPHAVVVFAGPARTRFDEMLEAAGQRRHVAVVLSSFLAVPYVLARSEAVAVLPAPYAKQLAAHGRLRCVPLPRALAQPPLRMRLLWPSRLGGSAAWRWLRDQIVQAASAHVLP